MKCKTCDGSGIAKGYDAILGEFFDIKCFTCNGSGEIDHYEEEQQKQTNFQRITASPEALAKVIMRIVTSSEAHGYNGYCLFDDFDFDEFMKNMKDYDEEVGTKTEYEHYKEVLMWLKQESE